MNPLAKRIADLSPEKRRLLERLLAREGIDAGAVILPRPREMTVCPLSFAQQRLWLLHQMDPGSPVYNTSFVLRFRGAVHTDALRRCHQELLRRHEVLRTTFTVRDGIPVQVIAPAPDTPVLATEIDLSALPEAEREARLTELAAAEARRPVDLENGPVFRATWVRLGDHEHVGLLTLHHIITDGWSHRVLLRELVALYEAFARGEPSPLPDLPIQYADYALWQRQTLQGPKFLDLLAYWKEQLDGVPPLELPADRPRPPIVTFAGALIPVAIPRALTEALRSLARSEGATLFMALLAAFQTLLFRYGGQEDIAVGAPVANRDRKELEGLIGFFVNALVLRTDLSGDPTFRELLGRVRQTALAAYDHQAMPFEKLVEELSPRRDLGRSPLFQVMLVLDQETLEALDRPDLALTISESRTGTAKFDLLLYLEESGRGLHGHLQYRTDLFEEASAARFLGYFRRLLEAIVAAPDSHLSALPLLSREEERQLLDDFNPHTSFATPLCLHSLFFQQAQRTPDAIALTCAGQHLSYGQLAERVRRLARRLQAQGAGPEVLVGLCAERSPELIVGLLGILAAGAAYVPLDPDYPAERLALLLDDARPPLVLVQRPLASRLPTHAARLVYLQADESVSEPGTLTDAASPGNAAYVIYTSGSTGRPRGVVVTHANVSRLFAASADDFHFGPSDVWTLFHSFAFDFSVWEVFGALLHGGRLVIVPHALSRAPAAFYRLLSEEGVTVLNQTPAAFRQLSNAEEAGPVLPLSLRVVIFGGEALDFASLRAWRRRHGEEPRLVNMYGITETTVHVTYHAIQSSEIEVSTASRIGRPLSDLRVYLLDGQGRPVPLGVAGELYVGGAGVARGYLNDPERTAARFVPDPFAQEPGARLYRSGDRARWRADGMLEYLGRVDEQVKIRGHRIEPGEVEAALLSQEGVAEAVVTAREDGQGDRRLVAYLVGRNGALSVSGVRAALRERLPEYLVPSAFVVLDALPLTAHGKVDRRALPAPSTERPDTGQEYEAPVGPIEETLAGIWAQVLGLTRVGARDNFFDLGGHSLLAAQVIACLRPAFGVELSLRSLFEAPTIAGLAEAIVAAQAAGGTKAPPLVPLPRQPGAVQTFPASFAQQRLWFLDQLQPNTPLYNVPGAVRVRGALNTAALRRSLQEILRRHEVLRTTFTLGTEGLTQVIVPTLEQPLTEVDLSALPAAEREVELRRRIDTEARQPFDLAHGPLLRGTLLRLAADDHVVLLTLHHVVADAWSLGVLIRELGALYPAFASGQASPLPELVVQYADYAMWQRDWLQGEVLAEQAAFWKEQLLELPPLELPSDRPRPTVPSFAGEQHDFEVALPVVEGLRALGRREGATLFMTLLAGFQALLARYSGQEDFAVGCPVAGRGRRELEALIGFFVNTLVLRANLSGDPSFRQLLGRVRETALAAYAHQDVPFEKLVEELQPERSTSRTPFFQTVLMLQQDAPRGVEGLSLRLLDADSGTVKFDLILVLTERAGSLHGAIKYRTDLFEAATIARMADHFCRLLEGAVADPESRVSALPLLSREEERQLLDDFNPHATFATPLCLHSLFFQQAQRTPDAIALTCAGQHLSYSQLADRARRLAVRLQAQGAGPEVLVGLCAERSPELIVGLLGILAAGAAYVPLDPDYPAERLALLLDDARPPLVLVQRPLASRLPTHAARLVYLEEAASDTDSEPGTLTDAASPGNAAYVIYTSGSTGRPRGVVVTHANVSRLFAASADDFHFGPEDVWTLFHSFAFDFSVWEVFGALLFGGRLVIVPHAISRAPAAFYRLLSEEGVTVLNQTPAAFRQLSNAEEAGPVLPLSLRVVIFGGEALDFASLRAWLRRHGEEPRLVNMYGITETTVHVTYHAIQPSEIEASTASRIGRPLSDLRVYLLDGKGRPVPLGVAGELYVGGAGVARGYLNDPERTAARFVPDPFAQEPGARLYRSGDRARWRADGTLEYLGRVDEQVKIRGHRIEPGEVEAALLDQEGVAEAVVIAREDGQGDRRLVAYLVDRNGSLSVRAVRASLRERLPEYLVPSAFVVLDALPLTAHGKVDRRALPAPSIDRPDTGQEYVAPRTDLEHLLAEHLAGVLGLERVGVQDNFFALGGDSIRGAMLINRLQQQLGETLYVVALFDAPTVAGLADYLEKHYPRAVARLCGRPLPEAAAEERVSTADLDHFRSLVRPLPPRAWHGQKNRRAVFVLAPPRSGTTLLRVLLAGHPRLFAPPELELLSFNTLAERSQAFQGRDRFWLEGLLRAVVELKRCTPDEARALVETWEQQGWSSQRCYAELQGYLGERLLVDKTPSYALDTRILQRAEEDFDAPLYLHLLRHPCGSIHSFAEVSLDQIFFRRDHSFSPRQLAELVWTTSQQNIRAFLQNVPAERQYHLRFEDLVQKPEEQLRAICAFLGLDYEVAMAQPYASPGRRMTDGLYPESRMLGDVKLLSHQRIDPAVAERWRGQVSEDSLGNETRAVASALGYPMPQRSDEARSGDRIQPLPRDQVGTTLAQLDQLPDDEVERLLQEALAEEGRGP